VSVSTRALIILYALFSSLAQWGISPQRMGTTWLGFRVMTTLSPTYQHEAVYAGEQEVRDRHGGRHHPFPIEP
jgi:hypothetical protein